MIKYTLYSVTKNTPGGSISAMFLLKIQEVVATLVVSCMLKRVVIIDLWMYY